MEKKKTLLILILVFILLLGGAYMLYNRFGSDLAPDQLMTPTKDHQSSSGTVPEEENSNPAPDFTVYSADGKPVHLSNYLGKPTVLNFWASWCGPCQMEMPDFQEKYQELGQDVNFLMVNMTDGSRETVKVASEFIAGKGYTFPVFYDTNSDAAMVYQVYSLPTTYFIDSEGNLIAQATGAISAATLQQGIDMIMP